WWLANAGALALCAPSLALAYQRFVAGGAQTTGLAAPNPAQFVLGGAVFVFFGRAADLGLSGAPAVLLMAACVLTAWRLARRHSAVAMLAGYAVVPFVGVYLMGALLPGVYDVRYIVVGLPAWIALLALAAEQVLQTGRIGPVQGRVALAAGGTAFALWTGLALARSAFDPAVARDDYRALFGQLHAQALPGELLIYDSPVQVTAVDYYARIGGPIGSLSLPLSDSPAQVESALNDAMSAHTGVWLMLALDRRHAVESWLNEHAVHVSEKWYGGGLRLEHYLPAPAGQAAALPGGARVAKSFGPLNLDQARIGQPTAGAVLPVRLLWTVQEAPSADYTVSVQVLDAAGVNRLAQHDAQPFDGALPTSRWQPGVGYVDYVGVPLPPAVGLPGAYQLKVSVYDSRQRPLGRQEPIGTLMNARDWHVVTAGARSVAGWTIDSVGLGHDGSGGSLIQAQVSVQRAPGGSYTWFAHTLDEQGKLLAQDDRQPLAPTLDWRPGDVQVESFRLPWTAAAAWF